VGGWPIRWRTERGIAGKRTRLYKGAGPRATQGDATRRDREWERKRRRRGGFSSRVAPRPSRGAPSSQVKRSLRRTDSVVAARSRLDGIYLPARGDSGRSVYRLYASSPESPPRKRARRPRTHARNTAIRLRGRRIRVLFFVSRVKCSSGTRWTNRDSEVRHRRMRMSRNVRRREHNWQEIL